MKKFLYMAVAAIAALSSCGSDNDVIGGVPEPANPNANAPVFTATIEGEAASRTALGLNSETGKYTKVNWESSDEVSINGTVYTVAPGNPDATTATLTKKNSTDASPTATFKAYYPASLYNEGTATLPASYTYAEGKFNMPMYAESSETALGFKNICAVLAITVPSTQMTSVSSITVSSDKQMNGAFTATTEGVLTFAEKTLEDADKKVTLTFSEAKAIATSETFYIAIPANTYAYLQIDVTDGTNTKYMRTKAASISVERNKIYPIAFAKNYDPNLLTGVFSVSATKKVKFTKGNLWCDASVSPATFGFETNQYDFPTSYNYPDDASTKLWSCTHVGHFFWSSYADYTLTEATATPGKPYEFKPYFSAYGPKSKSASDEFWCSEDHKLEVAGTQGLYVLSADEWAYLLNPPYLDSSTGRTQTNRFARARVNDTNGYLIFPDGYNGETAVSGIQGIGTVNEDGDSGYPSENIPDATWADMEAAGVVFLPNAGIRKGTEYTSGYGKYWSSTPNGVSNAKNTYFDANGIVFCPGNTYRSDGSSIRLVKTVE